MYVMFRVSAILLERQHFVVLLSGGCFVQQLFHLQLLSPGLCWLGCCR